MDEKDVLAGIDMSESLSHFGRMGMKWYQHIYGDDDPRAKYSKKGGVTKNQKAVASGAPEKAARKIKKVQMAEEKKRVKAEKAETKAKEKQRISQEEYDKKKQKILDSENARLVYENRNHFTTAEITAFNTRMEQLSKLQTTINGQKKTAKLLKAGKTFNDYTTTLTNSYNNFNNVKKMINAIDEQMKKKG